MIIDTFEKSYKVLESHREDIEPGNDLAIGTVERQVRNYSDSLGKIET